MSSETTNFGLIKPDEDEFYDIQVQNENMDKIDQQLKENADNIASANEAFNEHLAEIAVVGARQLGLACDGITNDTAKWKAILETASNIEIKLPDNSVTIITDRIGSHNDNVIISGKSATFKLADNSGIFNTLTGGRKDIAPLISFWGKNSGIKGVEIDGNIANNYVEINGERWHLFLENGLTTEQPFRAGHGGIGLFGDNTFAENCFVHDVPWDGIDVNNLNQNYEDLSTKTSDKKVLHCKVKNCGRDAITIHRSVNTIVKYNEIIDPQWHAIHDYYNSENSSIEENKLTLTQSNRVAMYPNHLTEIAEFPAIAIDHNSYRASSVKDSKVYKNLIVGDFNFGVDVLGYADSYSVKDNTIRNMKTAGIRLGMSLGTNLVESNTIDGCPQGISFAFYNDSTNPFYPTYTDILKFIIDVKNNKIDNCSYAHVYVSVRKNNIYDVSVIDEHLQLGILNIENNLFANTIIKPTYNVKYGYDSLDIPQLIINDRNNSSDNTYKVARTRYFYIDAVNGADTNLGTLNSPIKTIGEAIKRIDFVVNSDNKVVIRLLSDSSENISIDKIQSIGFDNFIVEGHNGSSNILRKVGNITLTGLDQIQFKYLKPLNSSGGADFFVNQCAIVRITNCDLTLTTGASSYGIYSLYGSQVIVIDTKISNKNTCIYATLGGRITAVNLTSDVVHNNTNGYMADAGIIQVSGAKLLATNNYKATNGGIIIKPDGTI